jgi:hypothetical protein
MKYAYIYMKYLGGMSTPGRSHRISHQETYGHRIMRIVETSRSNRLHHHWYHRVAPMDRPNHDRMPHRTMFGGIVKLDFTLCSIYTRHYQYQIINSFYDIYRQIQTYFSDTVCIFCVVWMYGMTGVCEVWSDMMRYINQW